MGTGLTFVDHNCASSVVASLYHGRVSQLKEFEEWIAPVSSLYLYEKKIIYPKLDQSSPNVQHPVLWAGSLGFAFPILGV